MRCAVPPGFLPAKVVGAEPAAPLRRTVSFSAAVETMQMNATNNPLNANFAFIVICSISPIEHFVRPGDEIFHVRTIFMAAVVLAPGELAVQQTGVYRRLFGGPVIFLFANILGV